jgi:flagellin
MGIGIDGNIGNVIPLRHLRGATADVRSALERLSSGRRINRAADDASGLSISEKLAAYEAAVEQGARNLGDGVSLARVAEGALSETAENLGRMRELAVQARNGTLGEAERAALQQEYDALAQEVTRVSQNTGFNGRSLLSGEISGSEAIRLEDGTGADEPIEVSVDDQSAEALGVAGLDVAGDATLSRLDDAIAGVSATRASLGTFERRVESEIRSLLVARENVASARSRIADADVAREQAELARAQLLQASGVAVRAQGRVHASVALRLIG